MISILLLDEDSTYAALLAQRLAAAGREFSVTANPLKSDTGLSVAADGSYDFVIVGESLAAAYAESADGARFIVLSESPLAPDGDGLRRMSGAADGSRGFLHVSRYGRVSGLAALIRAEHAVRSEGDGFPHGFAGGAVKYIACFGLGGRCGVSSIAIGIGRDLAAYKDRRVLYLSLETLEAERLCVRASENERHIGDFLYLMLRKREADLRLFSESCLFRDSYGLARFFPSPGLNDLARASSRELGDVLRFFDARGDFDLVILDLGSECGGHASELISLCDALVLVEDASPGDVGKRDRAEAFAREALRPGGANPLFVENMRRFRYGADDDCDGNDGNSGGAGTTGDGFGTDAASADGMDRITIGCDDASFRDFDGMRDFVLSGELGIGIRRLSDILFARVCE